MSEPLLEVLHKGQTYAMTPDTLLDELLYSSYAHNRRTCPTLSPARLRELIPEFTEAMEARYQRECHAR